MIEIEQIVNSISQSNSYVLYHKLYDWAWLVDAGDASKITCCLEKHDKWLKGIFLTHTHFDHIYGLNELYHSNPDIIIYTSPEGKDSLYNEKWNLSKYHQRPFVYQGCKIVELQEHDKIELWKDTLLEVFKTEGHDWSCLTYKTDSRLFTGDAYIPNIKTVTSFPKSNKEKAVESLYKIKHILGIHTIYPGHGQPKALTKTCS